jgi:hypothetical protein
MPVEDLDTGGSESGSPSPVRRRGASALRRAADVAQIEVSFQNRAAAFTTTRVGCPAPRARLKKAVDLGATERRRKIELEQSSPLPSKAHAATTPSSAIAARTASISIVHAARVWTLASGGRREAT